MGTGALLFCLALSLVCVSIYSRDVFDNIKDLKEKTDFGKYPPRQGLLLLCWLFSQGKVDQNGKLRLNFNPAESNFGFHQYKNYELTLPDLSYTHFRYFSLGNLLLRQAKQLPRYIIENISKARNHPQSNIDRIVIRVHRNNPSVVDEVYITQHHEDYSKGSTYVDELTHMIGKQLLKDIAELCRDDRDDSDRERDEEDPDRDGNPDRLKNIKNMYPTSPYLHRFLYITDYDASVRTKPPPRSKHSNINLQLISIPDGQVRIVWDGIPEEMLQWEVKIGVYVDGDEDVPLLEYPLNGREKGEIDTHLAVNRGFQLRLIKPTTVVETVYESPVSVDREIEVDDAVPTKRVEVSHPASTFSRLLSLVTSPFSALFSLVHFIVSSVLSLVHFIVRSVLSLVHFIVSSVLSLVHFIVSSVLSLLLSICQSILFVIGKLISLVFSILYQLIITVLSILVVEIVRRVIVNTINSRTRVSPQFVDVSHGRPGF